MAQLLSRAVGFMAAYIPPYEQVIELPLDELGVRILRLVEEQGQGHLMIRNNVGVASSWADYGESAQRPEFLQRPSRPGTGWSMRGSSRAIQATPVAGLT
jgi:hypothetical protein